MLLLLLTSPKLIYFTFVRFPWESFVRSGMKALPHYYSLTALIDCTNLALRIRNYLFVVFEIPIASKWVLELPQIDGVITLGCVIKGETSHDDVLNHAVSKTLLHIQIKYSKPLALGILTVNNLEQAKSRTIGPVSKKGEECADVICKMLLLKRTIQI